MYDRGGAAKQQEEASENTQGNALFPKKRKNADVRTGAADEVSFNIRVHNNKDDEQKPRATSLEGGEAGPEETKDAAAAEKRQKKPQEGGKQHKGKRRRERRPN